MAYSFSPGFTTSNELSCQHQFIRAIQQALLASCRELVLTIWSEFPEDYCICYPNYIEEADLQDKFKLRHPLRLTTALQKEFICQVLRLVRPGASENEKKACNSRFVKNLSASKILIPMLVNRELGEVSCIGYRQCYATETVEESEQSGYCLMEVVVDYEPTLTINSSVYAPMSRANSEFDLKNCISQASYTLSKAAPYNSTASETLTDFISSCSAISCPYEPMDSSCTLIRGANELSPLSFASICSIFCTQMRGLRSSDPFQIACKCGMAGLSTAKNRRRIQEDRLVVISDLHSYCGLSFPSLKKVSFQAIYDGHGGSEIADFVASRFHFCFCQQQVYCEKQDIVTALYATFEAMEIELVHRLRRLWKLKAFIKYQASTNTRESAFADELAAISSTETYAPTSESNNQRGLAWTSNEINDELTSELLKLESSVQALCTKYGLDLNSSDFTKYLDEMLYAENILTSGTTALIVINTDQHIYLANLGDSRCILMRGDCVSCLTEDHRLHTNARECERIKEFPGSFSCDGYLCGQLGVSRAFGNIARYTGKKLPGLSCKPDIVKIPLRSDDRFMVLASDGIFDTIAATDIASTTEQLMNQTSDLSSVAKALVDLSIDGDNDDNVSVIVIRFSNMKVDEVNRIPTNKISTCTFFKKYQFEKRQSSK